MKPPPSRVQGTGGEGLAAGEAVAAAARAAEEGEHDTSPEGEDPVAGVVVYRGGAGSTSERAPIVQCWEKKARDTDDTDQGHG